MAVKDDAGGKHDVDCHDKCRGCATIHLKKPEAFGGIKNLPVPTEYKATERTWNKTTKQQS